MTAEQFVYWLQGFMEINDPGYISKSETRVIKDHLALVFDKQTPAQEITTIPVPTTTPVAVPNKSPIVPNIICDTTEPTLPTPIDINSLKHMGAIQADDSSFNFVRDKTHSAGQDIVNKING
jgi:hypothetical protein